MAGNTRRRRSANFRRGDLVEVRSAGEILATLDADGRLDGLPFQPEGLEYCGGTFRIRNRLEKVYLDHHHYLARLKETVILDDLRCDGAAHNDCRMGCPLLWKEAWLKGVADDGHGDDVGPGESASIKPELPVRRGDRFICQATELVHATTRLPWWDLNHYVRDWVVGEMTLRQIVQAIVLFGYNRTQRMRGRPQFAELFGQQTKSPTETLDLQPGELVEVKTEDEIVENNEPKRTED